MSELINIVERPVRWRLLATASTLALVSSTISALADDTSRPTMWIELGGQLERVDGGQEPFTPPFVASVEQGGFRSPAELQGLPRYGVGAESKITFEPDNSDWVFSVSIRYGRSNDNSRVHDQKDRTPIQVYFKYQPAIETPQVAAFSDTLSQTHESHAVLDFQAGKDFGLGLFGKGGSSVVSAGLRFAQFSTKSKVTLYADPDYSISADAGCHALGGSPPCPSKHFHSYTARFQASRSAWAVGPSLSWDASAPLVGGSNGVQFTVDWGANGAMLFGRQKARTTHQTTGALYSAPTVLFNPVHYVSGYHRPASPHSRERSIIVPNVGGFAGVSLKFPNAKFSIGYRGDFFFGAMDGGIDTARKENVGFYGPFATISIGIGG